MCIFSNVCVVPPSLPGSDAVLLYGKISWGTPPIFPGSPRTIPVLCPRAEQGTKAGPGSRAGEPAAPLLRTGSPLFSLATGAGDGCHLAKSLPGNLSGPTLVVEVSHERGPLVKTLRSRCPCLPLRRCTLLAEHPAQSRAPFPSPSGAVRTQGHLVRWDISTSHPLLPVALPTWLYGEVASFHFRILGTEAQRKHFTDVSQEICGLARSHEPPSLVDPSSAKDCPFLWTWSTSCIEIYAEKKGWKPAI